MQTFQLQLICKRSSCRRNLTVNVYYCEETGNKERMYLWWSLCTLCLLACQVRVTVGDSGFCWCIFVTYFGALINSLVCWFEETGLLSCVCSRKLYCWGPFSWPSPWSLCNLWRTLIFTMTKLVKRNYNNAWIQGPNIYFKNIRKRSRHAAVGFEAS